MAVPGYSHIVVVVEENHDYNQIIANSQAPYINSLASGGALLTNYDAVSHPSEPNYFALYAGSTFGISDDNHYSEPDPTLYTILHGAGKTFTGYVETTDSDYDHNPWESFPEGFSVEKDFSTFPTSNFASLPTVSFVIPNVADDMHNGTIQQGDTWLQNNINSYAQWAKSNNSLLVVTWDENDGTSDGNHVATIFYGADVKTGTYTTAYNHYNLLSTLLAASNLTGPRNAATAAPIDVFSTSVGGTLAGQVLLSSATEGTAIPSGTTIASFTDSNASDTAAGFAATITWGDGTSSDGTITGSNGSFAVSGGHTYTDEGNDPLSVVITRTADGSNITPTGTVTVAEGDILTAHATTIAATAGQALSNVSVASFTDVNTGALAGDLAAMIDWGDGTTSAGSVSGSSGTFTVSGSHTFANPGTDRVSVTLTDDDPGTATATVSSTAEVGSGAGNLAGQVQLSTATEGKAIPAGTTIASFTGSRSDTRAGFTATINWGDGTSSAGTITGRKGSFAVAGGHSYADEGNDPLSVVITRTADGSSITPTGTVTVAEGDVLTAHATTIAATAGQALSNVAVASFTDVNTGAVAGDFAAMIDWGDGTSSAGTVSGGSGTFTVSGSHTYANPGTDTVSVTLADDDPGTATATASSTAQVGSGSGTGTLAGQVLLSSATEGRAVPAGTAIARFTDSDTSDTAAGFTATIRWGDGNSAGTITGGNGSFTVTGGHTYADEGNDPLSVVITRTADGSSITPTGTVTVAEGDILTAHATTIAATAGQALSNVSVASFTDVNTGALAGDFAAMIDWGDGTTSAGSVSGSSGTFTVSGSHTFANPGTDTVSVTLTDDDPGTATATASSTAQISSGSGGGGQTISGSVAGPIQLSGANAAVTITSTGGVTSTGSGSDGVDSSPSAPSTVTNFGTVEAVGGGYSAGIWLENGGTVTNAAGAFISASYGIEVSGGSGVITNSGTISGSNYAVLFANAAPDRLVVEPNAVFNGPVQGGSGSNTLELAGTGSIVGLSGGSGSVTQNGGWSFRGFGTLAVDDGADWTLNGGNVPTLVNDGTIAVSGSLDVSSAIDPTSSGIFQLTSGATLDVAAAIGSAARMSFLGTSELVIDNPLSFGSHVGSASYAGPLLQGFGAGAEIDLKQFAATGTAMQYNPTVGILQLSDSGGQSASLAFQPSSLGDGLFHVSSDGGGGILLTRG